MRILLMTLLLLLLSAATVAALEITSLFPSTVTPGATVTLTGGPFAAGDIVLVGDRRFVVTALESTRLTFTLPELAAGEYALTVERAGQRSERHFMLRVVLPPPRIDLLSPATLDSCIVAGQRQVTVSGSNFQPSANLLLDNTAIAIDKLDSGEIVFTLPAVKPGLHQVQVVNPDNQSSLPHGLFLSSTPELTAVQTGDDRTLDYDLILQGKNFFFDSRLSVNGEVVGKTVGDMSPDGSLRQMVRYVDCSTLIYMRRPFMREPRELSLQVINPGGEQSNVYQLTAP